MCDCNTNARIIVIQDIVIKVIDMYKVIRKLHLWLSVPFGIVIAVICLTGLILLFEPAHEHGAQRPEFFLDVMRLHRWLLDAPAQKGAMSVGKFVVGLSVVAMVLIMFSGIALWWLRARRGLRRSLKLRVGHGWHLFLTSLHTAGGMYVVLILLVLALTGLTWSFGWYREWFKSLFGIETSSHIIYEIHTGSVGGIVTKVIWFVAALIGFTMPLTGYYIWFHRLWLRSDRS